MTHFIDNFGYWAVAIFVLAESLGVPLPGETAVILAGVYAGHTHKLSPWAIFAVAAAAAVAGGYAGYGLGRFGGYHLVRRFGPKVGFDARKFKTSRYLFDTYGVAVVFFGRFVSILRTYAAFLAGTSRMNIGGFSLANVAGGVLWAGLFTTIAYLAGDTLRRISGTLDIVLAALAVMVVVVLVIFTRKRFAEFAARAEAAYPGELE
jgi:membrane protein DedA with SNARE-associated domain